MGDAVPVSASIDFDILYGTSAKTTEEKGKGKGRGRGFQRGFQSSWMWIALGKQLTAPYSQILDLRHRWEFGKSYRRRRRRLLDYTRAGASEDMRARVKSEAACTLDGGVARSGARTCKSGISTHLGLVLLFTCGRSVFLRNSSVSMSMYVGGNTCGE